MQVQRFKTSFAENIFRQKYAIGEGDTWDALAERVVNDVCIDTTRPLMSKEDREQLMQYIKEMKFIPGGRYLYYAGKGFKAFNNCYLLKCEEDTREEWANIVWRAMSCLSTGGGIGIDYSVLRPSGRVLSRTGGRASGPLPLMYAVNEIGRNVMQGGSRRSAIYGSLNWQHEDAQMLLVAKNWSDEIKALKAKDFSFPASLDMTNISLNYDNKWLFGDGEFIKYTQDGPKPFYPGTAFELTERWKDPTFLQNCKQAMMTGEPGFSFNFGDKENETLRNAPVSGDTRVLTSEGYKNVIDIVWDKVNVWTGVRWAETTFKLTKKFVNTLEVCLSNGRSICCDPEHPFIVWTKEGQHKIESSKLREGDAIVSTLPMDKIVDYPLDIHYGYGFVFGDGSIRNGRGELSYWTESKKEAYEHACLDLGARSRSKDNRAYFKTEMLEKKFMPYTGFVAGWFDADGCYTRDLLRLSCKDEGNLFVLQEYLDTLGIMSSVRQDGCSGFNPDNNIYTLTVYKNSHERFKKLIPTIRLKITTKSARQQNILVTSVAPRVQQENVYCCDVNYPEHSFMAEGVLIGNCTEVTSEDDSDVCNLGSVNLGNCKDLEEFKSVVSLATKFLVCGTIRADLPYEKVKQVREKNRRLGLGLMGIHEWLLQRGSKYEVTPELHKWMEVYRDESDRAAKEHCERLFISSPRAVRAIAPTGSIGILASTTTGIEPLFAVAYKRRYLTDGTKWKYEYVIDATAERLIGDTGTNPSDIDTAYKLAHDYERRIAFQATIQDYVDMSISSTINLPPWGTKGNSEGDVERFANTLSKYAPRLRGFTAYPDGSRGGQPLTEIEYSDAVQHKGVVFEEHSICDITKGGVCGE